MYEGDDDDDESSDDDEEDDDDVDIEEDEDEEEEEHLALVDSTVVALPTVDHALSTEETEPFETEESAATPPPHPTYRITARISIRPQTPISLPSDTEIARLMAIPTPPPSPLSPFLSYPLCYRAAIIRLRAEAPSTSHPLLSPSTYHLTPPSGTPPLLPIPLPTPSSPLLLPSTDPRAGVREGAPATNETELGRRMTDLVETMRCDTDEIYTRLDDAQSERQLMASRLNLLGRDRRTHAHTALLMEREARITVFRNHEVTGGRSQETGTVHRGTKTSDETSNLDDRKMALKRTTRANPVTTTTTTTTSVTDAQLEALIEQGVAKALVARDADRNINGDDNHELALLCVRMFPEESDKIERYVGGLPDMIHGSVVASKPKTIQEAIKMAAELMDKKIRTFAERQTETKIKQVDNQQQYQQNKRQNTDKAYAWNKVGHFAHNYRSTSNVNTANNQRGNGTGQKYTCYECGAQGHFKKDCPKLKNNNRGTQGGKATAPAKVYAVGRTGINQDSNVITGMFLLNNRYASILFDTGADRSFVSTSFSSQIAITSTTLDHYYEIELADRRIIGLNTILKGCTLNFLNHPFNIDLIPIELGSFDTIISMDWLEKYHAIIVYEEKIVRIPGEMKS
nr:hypothetical protein [Tanacetum cinerariifolium]